MSWAEAPAVPEQDKRDLPILGRELIALAVALVGPVLFALNNMTSAPLIARVIVISSLVLAVVPARWWPVRLFLTAMAGYVLSRTEGDLVAIWSAAGLGLADWAVRRRSPLPFLPRPSRTAVWPVVVLMGLAAYRGRDGVPARALLVPVAIAVVVTTIGVLSGGALDRQVRRFGHLVGEIVGRVAFAIAGAFTVLLPWGLHRVVGVDPLRWPSTPGTSWLRRETGDPQSPHPWSDEAIVASRPTAERVRRALVAPLVVGLVVVVALLTVPDLRRPSQPEPALVLGSTGIMGGHPAAYAGQSWYQEYSEDISWIMSEKAAWRPLRARRFADVHTRHVNIVDGLRESWRAPACSCRRMTVWLYGGSTAFGMGQRDGHTIPSELAREAWRHHIALDVVNRGVPGLMHWSEAQLFAWDLTVDDPPDLVVFYDGVNEIWGVKHLKDTRDLDEPLDPLTEDIWSQLQDRAPKSPAHGNGYELTDLPSVDDRSEQQWGALAARNYDRSRNISRDVGRANRIPVRWFWQPSRLSRPPAEGEPVQPAESERDLRELYGAAARRVPSGVVDLSDVLDGNHDPIYTDDFHHNEVGARIIAKAIYRNLRADIHRLLDGERIDP